MDGKTSYAKAASSIDKMFTELATKLDLTSSIARNCFNGYVRTHAYEVPVVVDVPQEAAEVGGGGARGKKRSSAVRSKLPACMMQSKLIVGVADKLAKMSGGESKQREMARMSLELSS